MRYLLLILTASACTLSVDYTGTFYQCGEGGTCPDGYTCIQDVCIPEEPPPPACSSGIAAGGRHSCSIRDDGTLWCWGRNSFGQLGDGTKTSSAAPVQVADLVDVIAVSTGWEHTCAIVEGGTAYCWGANTLGQLGDGTSGDSTTPSMLPIANVTAIGAGTEFSCAIANGTVSCWGRNMEGQVGDGTMTQRNSPTSTNFAASKLIVFGDTACAINASNEARCWGENGAGQMGLGDGMDRNAPTVIGTDITDVAVGEDHLCIRRTSGGIACAGQDNFGQLGWGYLGNSDELVDVSVGVNLSKLVAGAAHTCGVDDDKRVWCWGLGEDGRVANGDDYNPGYPVRTKLEDIDELVAGADHTCGRTQAGAVYCAGFNGHAQLGNGYATTHATPFAIPDLTGVKQIALGYEFSCALKTDKTVACWGEGEEGELAYGYLSSPTPVAADGITNVKTLRAGGGHVCALGEDGTVSCWGLNNWGQVGNDTRTSVATPTVVELPGPAMEVATGNDFTCALVGGNVWCWGLGEQGQLGQGAFDFGYHEPLPVQVMGLTGVSAIAAGEQHACAITGGNVQCWGANYYGGLGTTGGSSGVPVTAGITNVTAISARSGTTFAVSNGALWGWGTNCNARLTAGNCGSNPAPVALPALAGVTNVRPGFTSSCGLRNGGVTCWGNGDLGQTGDDSYEFDVPPTQIVGLDGIMDVEAGGAHACAVHVDGRVSCWGYNGDGQVGDGHTATEGPVGVRLVCD
jgi:alpha-tubulin suppressor-like RCC1 family protein